MPMVTGHTSSPQPGPWPNNRPGDALGKNCGLFEVDPVARRFQHTVLQPVASLGFARDHADGLGGHGIGQGHREAIFAVGRPTRPEERAQTAIEREVGSVIPPGRQRRLGRAVQAGIACLRTKQAVWRNRLLLKIRTFPENIESLLSGRFEEAYLDRVDAGLQTDTTAFLAVRVQTVVVDNLGPGDAQDAAARNSRS